MVPEFLDEHLDGLVDVPLRLRAELGGLLGARAHDPDSSTTNGVDVAGIGLEIG
jgi:hypothetical protein